MKVKTISVKYAEKVQTGSYQSADFELTWFAQIEEDDKEDPLIISNRMYNEIRRLAEQWIEDRLGRKRDLPKKR